MLEYLIKNTLFNFDLKDRFGTKVIDEIRDPIQKKRISELIEFREQKIRETKFAKRPRAYTNESYD